MFNKVSVAVAAALFSSSTFALPPTVTPDLELWMSGAVTLDIGIARLFEEICVAGTLDVYKDGTISPVAVSGIKHQAYFCTVDRTQISDTTAEYGGIGDGVLANTVGNPNVLFHKRSEGGSAQGVDPVINTATGIAFMIVNNTNCALSTANLYACSLATTELKVPDAGASDVNPEMFIGANGVPTIYNADLATGANGVGLKVTSGVAVLFGIPVSEPLYRALQLVQGKIPTATTIDDSEAAMPSLSKYEVASIMFGRIKTWENFKVGPAPGFGLRTYAVSLGAAAPFNNLVNICRRTNGSPAQAQMSAKFLNYPCNSGSVTPTETSNSILGPIVMTSASSGDVDTCLNTAGTLGSAAATATSAGNNRWAIGLQSMVKNPLVDTTVPPDGIVDAYLLKYRFVKINGVAPNLANAANGDYLDWVETTYQWRTAGDPANLMTQDERDIMFTIANNAGKTSIVRDVLNPGIVYSFGQSGYLALDSAFPATLNVPTCPFVTTNPVMPYTHTIGGGTDNCRTPVVLTTDC